MRTLTSHSDLKLILRLAREQIIPYCDGYSLICKCFTRKCAHLIEIDNQVFLPKKNPDRGPQKWFGPTGGRVGCRAVRCRAPPARFHPRPQSDPGVFKTLLVRALHVQGPESTRSQTLRHRTLESNHLYPRHGPLSLTGEHHHTPPKKWGVLEFCETVVPVEW